MQMPMDDFSQQQLDIMQRRKRAQEGQVFKSPEGQMVSGRYVAPNALQYLAEGLRNVSNMQDEQKYGQELKDLRTKRQETETKDMNAFIDLLRDKPAVASTTTPTQIPSFDDADAQSMQGVSGYGATTGAQAARPGDPVAAYSMAASSQSPTLRKIGAEGTISLATEQAKLRTAQAQQQKYIDILRNAKTPQDALAAGVPFETVKNFTESKDLGRQKVQYKDVGGKLVPVTEYGDQPTGVKPLDKTGNPFSDLVLRGPNGQMTPNTPLVGVKQGIARSGASNVSVNTANKPMLTELGKGVGEGITNAWTGAQSAAGTLQNVQQMRTGLEKAIVGPGANQRVTLSQIGQVLGVNGKDATEQLENTRMVMQGLARQELSAAGQMKGQGQITESERSILRKAESGQINELTKPELNTLLGALERTATSRINTHNQNLQRLRQDQNAAGVAQFMQVDAPTMGGGGGGNAGLNAAVEAEIKRRQGGR
jgi:hypothetical protein